MRVAIGFDPNAIAYAAIARGICNDMGVRVVKFEGDDTIYANTAVQISQLVVNHEVDRAILICGTGIGMSIAANKVPGAYAALISDTYSAQHAQTSNHANIACFGALTVGAKSFEQFLTIWLTTEYVEGTASALKIERICEYEHIFWNGCK